MFKINLKIALRNLWKYRGYTAINIAGLAIGLASCLLIFTFLRYQLSFDKGYPNQERIYRVVSSWAFPDRDFFSNGVPVPLAPALRNDFPQLEKVAGIQEEDGIVKVKGENGNPDTKFNESVFYTEPQLFEILSVSWLAGQAGDLAAPNQVALSEKTANKYFGSWKNAVGKTIRYDNDRNFKISGVFKNFKENTSLPLNIAVSYASFPRKDQKEWQYVSSSTSCLVLLKPGVNVEDLKKPMLKFIDKYYVLKGPARENHIFQKLEDVHHDTRFSNYSGRTMPYKQLLGLAIIGFFLLITACINFINLATAQAVSRSKEVGVRKVMGSKRKQLIWQFLSETALITLIALLLACVLTELTIPSLEGLFSEDISLKLFGEPLIYLFMGLLVLLVSFLAGFYPAMVMSGFSPALAIKNKISVSNAGGMSLRKTLVVLQFAITAVLIIATLVVVKQMKYVQEKSLGFDKGAMVMVGVPMDNASRTKQALLKQKLMQIPGIKKLSFCSGPPLSSSNNENSFYYDQRGEMEKFQLSLKMADENYLETFNLPVVAGQGLVKSDTLKGYVVNEKFVQLMGISDPKTVLGKTIKSDKLYSRIIGVIKNFNNRSLHEEITPIAIYTDHTNYEFIALKLDGHDMVNTMKRVEAEWNGMFPDYVYKADFLDEYLQNFYEIEKIMGILFKVFAGVVIFISFIGLFGLVSFIATQKTKEIAIRKVLGASTAELINMLNRSFLWMVLTANLVAWPLAYVFMSRWLNSFVYRIELGIWPFVIAMLLSIVVTLITVSLRSYRAAKTNPIDALKYE